MQANAEGWTKQVEKTGRVSPYGIETSRLASAGFGDTRPIAPSDTDEGRQKNRRVDLVRLG